MSDHEFYAEPTVFDHWQTRIGSWLCSRFSGLCPYGWVIGFGVLGLVFLVIAMAAFALILNSSADSSPLVWNQSIAQTLIVLIGLTAAQMLFRQALVGWPSQIELPVFWRRMGCYIGSQQPIRQQSAKQTVATTELYRPNPVPKQSAEDRQAIQDFFAGVRAAGVNVAIAKALFGAGIRSPRQLLKARDRHLHAIHGVGPATVRKLRAQFQR